MSERALTAKDLEDCAQYGCEGPHPMSVPDEPPLDVERLARAIGVHLTDIGLHAHGENCGEPYHETFDWSYELAARVARDYTSRRFEPAATEDT